MQEIRLIIADDQPVVRSGVRRVFEREKGVTLVSDLSDGLETVRVTADLKPDVVLVGSKLSEIDGIEVTKRIKQTSPDVGVILFSCCHTDKDIIEAVKAGVDGYLPKDSPPADIVKAVMSVSQGSSFLHPKVAKTVFGGVRSGSPAGSVHAVALTAREAEILSLMARGLRNAEIGKELWISETTVKAHVGSIFRKLGTRDRVKTIIEAVKKGMVDLGG
ncbi:MAG: response regulator [Terriglobia bacterium]